MVVDGGEWWRSEGEQLFSDLTVRGVRILCVCGYVRERERGRDRECVSVRV